MTHQDRLSDSGNCITVEEINAILEQYDSFIYYLARRYIPRGILFGGVIDMDVEDLVQKTRIKLWTALQKHDIHSMKSYIRRIVRNETVDMVRQHKPVVPLSTSDDSELPQSSRLVAVGQEVSDPTEHVEAKEMLASYSSNLPEHVVKLPPLQQRAMICELKDRIADLLPLVDMFQRHGMDIKNVAWPKAENELRSSRVSLSIARKKLRATMKVEEW